jgi:hypothetical protein
VGHYDGCSFDRCQDYADETIVIRTLSEMASAPLCPAHRQLVRYVQAGLRAGQLILRDDFDRGVRVGWQPIGAKATGV